MKWIGILRYFYLLGAVNALFFCILIFSKPKRSLADKLLGFWLVILSLQLLFPFLYLSDLSLYFQYAGLEVTFYAVHPLLLYLYVLAMTGRFPSRNRLVLLILGSLLVEISVLSFFVIPANERLNLLLGKEPIQEIYYLFFMPIVFYFFIYFFLTNNSLRNYKSNILQVYSYKENVDLLWLRRLVLLFYGLLLMCIPMVVLFYLDHISIALGDYFYFAGLTIFIFLLGYWGYKQGHIFNLQPIVEEKKNAINQNHENESVLNPKTTNGKGFELTHLMKEQQPFLNPTLTIFELAKLIDMQPPHLSKLISKEFNCNFFEYINRYRIEIFKEYLISDKYKDYTLLAIALECGFNSKSAFNRIFKEQTGTTPGEFKKQFQFNKVSIN